MDWDLAIKRNSEILIEIVADLFTMLGLVGEATVSRLSWPAYRAVLRVLRPAESALRRLIVVAARGLVVKPAGSCPKPARAVKPGKRGTSRPSFQLFDPRTRIMLPRRRKLPRTFPRIHMFNADGKLVTCTAAPPQPAHPAPAKSAVGMVNGRASSEAESLRPRSKSARQAPASGAWRMREEKSENPSFKTPLRPGRPPGYRRRAVHLVDELLSECDWLAFRAAMTDTS